MPCTNISIRRAARRLAYLYDEAAECVDLKATQVTLAGTIDQLTNMHTAQGPTLLELAGAQAIQISALTHALRPLVRDGLVALQPDAQDKRTKRATLTDEGKTRLKQALLAWSAVVEGMRQRTLAFPADETAAKAGFNPASKAGDFGFSYAATGGYTLTATGAGRLAGCSLTLAADGARGQSGCPGSSGDGW